MTTKPEAGAREPSWTRLVELSGEAGSRWLEDYGRPERQAVYQATEEALARLRGRDLAGGRRALDAAGRALDALDVPHSVRHVLERWYFGVLAYLEYCAGEFAAADASLQRADRAVCRALGAEWSLLPLAHHCHEFRLHRARVQRNQRRWAEVEAHVEAARGMIDDRVPLCVLDDGRAVYLSTLAAFLAAIPALSEQERAGLRYFFDPPYRRGLFESFVANLYLLPGYVVAPEAGGHARSHGSA